MAKEILGDFQGYLQTDGYEVYDRVSEAKEKLIHVACWAHARRKFYEAKKSSQKAGSAEMALAVIGRLYQVEAKRKLHVDPEAFAVARRIEVERILAEQHAWLQQRARQVPPTTLLGKAIGYAMAQWPKLLRYLDHPQITPESNASEGAIRPFVLARKNWLFSGSPIGAQASAVLFSIIEAAKANGLDPYWYLRKLFEELPAARTDADVLRMTPFRSSQS